MWKYPYVIINMGQKLRGLKIPPMKLGGKIDENFLLIGRNYQLIWYLLMYALYSYDHTCTERITVTLLQIFSNILATVSLAHL